MRRIVQNSLLLVLLAISGGCGVQAHQYYVQEQHTEKPNAMTITRRTAAFDSIAPSLAAQIKKLVDEKVYPGISVAVILDGRSIWSFQAGTQHLETNERITERTCFRLASITKTFTALAVLGLRDEGRLHLDEPIAKTVRQALTWRSHTSDSAPITWRHLLTHTSGLPRVGPLDFTRTDKGPTKTRLEHLFKDIESLNSPGVETRYSNLGYAVLGLAISKRAGRSYEEEIHRRFLKPLSMTDAGFSRSDCDKTATGYARKRETGALQFTPQPDWKFGDAAAVGGLYASTDAISRWLIYQMDAWPPRNTNDTGPIRRSTRRESHRLGGFSHPGQASFGLGWGVSTFGQSRDVLVSHSGSTWTWGASVRMLVERGIGIVALGNSGGSLPLSRFTLKALQQIDRVLNADGVARPRRTRARKSPVRRR